MKTPKAIDLGKESIPLPSKAEKRKLIFAVVAVTVFALLAGSGLYCYSQIGDKNLRAKKLAEAGKYEEALACFVEFYSETLQRDYYTYRGVRNTFALSDWGKLARQYPPALTALQNIRNAKAALLLSGDFSQMKIDPEIRESAENNQEKMNQRIAVIIFSDVKAIDLELRQKERLISFYHEFSKAQPSLAAHCWSLIFNEIIENGDIKLAERYSPGIMTLWNEQKKAFLRWKTILDEQHFSSELPEREIGRATANLVYLANQTGKTHIAKEMITAARQLLSESNQKKYLSAD